jgi:predicted acetyltransferase
MELVPVTPEDRELLWNLNQKYLYEMTNFYDDEMDAAGVLHYGYFDAYFTDPKRKAFFLYEQRRLVGFAMIHPYSNMDGAPDYVLAEFTVFPMYRRRHLAAGAAELIFRRFRGSWEVKYNEKNAPAKGLWYKVTAPYHPQITRLNEEETVLSFRTD